MCRRIYGAALSLSLVFMLAACGGASSGSDPTPLVAASPTVGASGGTVLGEDRIQVVVPANALSADVTIRIAKDSTGAPVMPAWIHPAGDMVAITPHGSEFAQAVTVRLPVPNVSLQANQQLFIAKAQPGGEWEVLGETIQNGGLLEANVSSFSFFTPVVVTYPTTLTPATFPPFAVSSVTLECAGQPCVNAELLRPMTITATVTHNGGQLPADCVDPKIVLRSPTSHAYDYGDPIDIPPGGAVRVDIFPHFDSRSDIYIDARVIVEARLRCTDASTNAISYLSSARATFSMDIGFRSPNTPYLVQFPTAFVQAIGDTPTLRAVFIGGASFRRSDNSFAAPTATNEAVVYLERLSPSDGAWRTVATSQQTAADPNPMGSPAPRWLYWSFDYALAPLTLADNGTVYRMRACYQAPGTAQASCAAGETSRMTLVQQTQAPAFTQQPRSVLIAPGQTASFGVVASGTPAPTLQWQTRPANSSGDWTDVSTGGGATTPNYTTPVVSLADNGVQYRVLATNSAAVTPSSAVTVSVAPTVEAPSIVSQPAALTVIAGSEAVFAVSARGTEALSYQWHKGGRPVAGGNSPQLKISNVTLADAGSYSVRVSNAVGGLFSDIVKLDVTEGAPSAASAPSIVTQPAAVAVTEGNVATFAVGVSGSGPLAFQWRKNGVDIAGATAAAYTFAAVAPADSGTYSVQVSNSAGVVISQSATLAVASVVAAPAAVAPTIVTQPGNIVVAPGMSAMFGVGVQGTGPISFQWLRDGLAVPDQTQAIYAIAIASGLDAGLYQVQVSNSAGTVTSAPSQVIILGAPAIGSQPAAQSARAGTSATFSALASGSNLRYQWTLNGVAISGATSASYTTPVLAPSDNGGVYGVVVYNGAGVSISTGAVLAVQLVVLPSVLQQPGNLTIDAGLPANICMAFGGTAPFNVLMQRWDGAQWVSIGSGIPFNDNSLTCVSTPNLQLSDSGAKFLFIAINAAGEVMTNTVTVTVASSAPIALVANYNSNTLSIFRANASTGALASLGTVATGANPYAVAISPNGLYAYASNLVGGTISSFGIDRATGVLTPIPLSSPGTQNPYGIAVDPLGRFLWVANYGYNTVSAFVIGTNGVLAPSGPPLATGSFPRTVAAHPSGNFVYVASEGAHSISVYSVNASTGTLTLVPGTLANSVLTSNRITIDPSGQFAYVADATSVDAFKINASTGALSLIGYYNNVPSSPSSVAVHPNGQYLYVLGLASQDIGIFQITTGTGALEALGGGTALTGSGPQGLAINSSGSFLYVTNSAGNSASTFSINTSNGALTEVGTAQATGSQPGGIAITP